jgi:Beta-xylosidase
MYWPKGQGVYLVHIQKKSNWLYLLLKLWNPIKVVWLMIRMEIGIF